MANQSNAGREVRSTAEVFDDHLRRSSARDLEGDLLENFDEECVILTSSGIHRGYDGVRKLADRLFHQLPSAQWQYTARHVAGKVAFLEWTAHDEGAAVEDGADSFVIENGKITAQTIHYTVRYADGRTESA